MRWWDNKNFRSFYAPHFTIQVMLAMTFVISDGECLLTWIFKEYCSKCLKRYLKVLSMQSPQRLLKKYLYGSMNLPILSSQKPEVLVPCLTNKHNTDNKLSPTLWMQEKSALIYKGVSAADPSRLRVLRGGPSGGPCLD